ncbi:hypothetical protein UA45_21480 [Morganella morganii]|uniref:Uncharacterized protein n=1 Tax=Morganella morganii TaxID=582 RepID=A0A0D8L2F3_MORMO|nr:hypothetical protein UA45_21480 [Morganella morganii]
MTAIVFPHVCCNDGIITDLYGYGCIPANLGLPEKFADKKNFFSSSNQAGVRPSENSDISFVTLSTGHVGVWSNTAGEFLWYFTGSK